MTKYNIKLYCTVFDCLNWIASVVGDNTQRGQCGGTPTRANRGLAGKDNLNDDNILDIAPKETLEELNAISDELLRKAGLIEMNEKLKTF